MNDIAKHLLSIAKSIQGEVPKIGMPPVVGVRPKSEQVLPSTLVKGTRGYIEQVVNQINGCYEQGSFDACAVMMRRLIETLIIEVYEHHGIADKIKNANGDFLHLKELIDLTLTETVWNLGRNTKTAIRNLKSVGDLSAHNRRYIAHRQDIDKLIVDMRIVVQELVYLSQLK